MHESHPKPDGTYWVDRALRAEARLRELEGSTEYTDLGLITIEPFESHRGAYQMHMYLCQRCGALVAYRAQHNREHGGQ